MNSKKRMTLAEIRLALQHIIRHNQAVQDELLSTQTTSNQSAIQAARAGGRQQVAQDVLSALCRDPTELRAVLLRQADQSSQHGRNQR